MSLPSLLVTSWRATVLARLLFPADNICLFFFSKAKLDGRVPIKTCGLICSQLFFSQWQLKGEAELEAISEKLHFENWIDNPNSSFILIYFWEKMLIYL